MKEKKNIDRIYQEKFKDFEREPNERVWENISAKLDKKDKKEPIIIPLWFKLGGVAAVIALVFASLLFTNNNNSNPSEPGVVFENEDNAEKEEPINPNQENSINNNTSEEGVAFEDQEFKEDYSSENSSNQAHSQNSSNNSSRSVNTPTRKDFSTDNQKKKNAAFAMEDTDSSETIYEKEKSAIKPEGIEVKPSGEIVQNKETLIDPTKTKSILEEENALAEVEEEKKKSEEAEENVEELNTGRLSLSTFAAPIFYRNIGSGNELSNQFSNNNSSSEVTFSYGFKVAYQVSKKLRIRTGISKVNISNNIENISYSPSAMAAGFENIGPEAGNLSIRDNTPTEGDLPSGMNFSSSVSSSIFVPGELNQQFGYIEIPVEVEFAIIDKKFGLNIIGGGSSLFLDNNRVELISEEGRTNLGEASNINNTSFSTNIGLGMDYNLNKKFSISVEPIFKYQLNTFNSVSNVQPVNFGVYSGLNFRF
ncbi:hypothetical protein ML462_05060 [Gramella lutea]|uniref:Outer membrane protein beta-barrel domain-containing protein n=1 Tax=Christiangramia lutea TaxID=1607951 RepID=A0A9X2A8P6_9FLAO|nr:hypothetical protein [Christiangramia lutea]MCH4822535.1 hypothetical protein [Christiangramia lutea]